MALKKSLLRKSLLPKAETFDCLLQAKSTAHRFQPIALAAALAAALLTGGCGSDAELLGGAFGSGDDRLGGIVVADEPRAAVAAREVLRTGGNAADAAVALYFTLAVTLPSSASLGGGGICLIHDPVEKKVEVLDFMPRAMPDGQLGAPGNVRGMGALHARFGSLRWAQLLAGPERLARFGTPTSRALARELTSAGEALLADPLVRAIFAPGGRLVDEGEALQQIELASVLGQIRQRGAGEFYSGALAKSFVAAVHSIGGDLSIDALRAVTPQFLDPVTLPVGDHVLNVTPPPAAGGIYAAELIRMLTSARDYEAASQTEKPHLLVEAMKRAIADREGWMRPDGSSSADPATLVSAEHAAALMQDYSPDRPTPVESLPTPPVARPENPWATGFVVADRRGQAVACNLTMNMLFGTGRMAPGTGIFLAPAPGAGGASDVDLGPIMLVNEHTGGFHYAAAASGGTTAPTAMAQVFLANVLAGTGIADAIGARRLHHNGDPDIVFHEPGEPPARLDILKAMGYRTEQVEILGRVNAIACPGGIARKPQTCQAASDTRANGLALLLLSD